MINYKLLIIFTTPFKQPQQWQSHPTNITDASCLPHIHITKPMNTYQSSVTETL